MGISGVRGCSRSVRSESRGALRRLPEPGEREADGVSLAILAQSAVPFPNRRAVRTPTTAKRRPCKRVPGTGLADAALRRVGLRHDLLRGGGLFGPGESCSPIARIE